MPIPWIRLPAAAALLESCAASPPPTRIVRGDHGGYEPHYCSTTGAHADRRVAELRRIHAAEWVRLLTALAGGEATRQACAAHARLDAQAAIRAAIADVRWLEAAE